ncbi:MAG TPA: ribonuclease domain-containing protein [Nocardioides sp.]|nr:ribonuclease domain-containing protein [Nocardioides sp.]
MALDRRTLLGLLVAAVAAALVFLQWTGPSDHDTSPSGQLPTIAVADLPPEARHTLALIDAGGPFPYEQDGVVFHNYEGVLPPERDGYYHEYTVETPGSDDRGARRIVTGSPGQGPTEYYWTDDHYQSFERILR